MKLLVTGAAGFLGSELCRQAVAAGHDAVAVRLRREPPYGRPLRCDLRDDAEVQRMLMEHGPDAVVHAAYRQGTREVMEQDVVRASRNVALAAHRAGARLVHLSSDVVFDGEHGVPYTEKSEPRPVSDYGEAKLRAERLVAAAHPGAALVRTSLLYGRPDGAQERLAARGGEFYFDEIRCPTHVEDIAAALLELGEHEGVSGPLHLAAPEAVSRLALARLLGATDAHGVPSPRVGRPRDLTLDSSRAASLLRSTLRPVSALRG
ncbi:MAG TPA: SDR family oxidoreductase [Gaiellaceae bacterium]|nr:SDR family oxidoreductase [Gaiellaceae bacterium]